MKQQNRITYWQILFSSCLLAFAWLALGGLVGIVRAESSFSGQLAYEFAEAQLALGPRTPGSDAHAAFIQLATDEFAALGWNVSYLRGKIKNVEGTNLIIERPGAAGQTDRPWVLLGAHFDSRLEANEDPDPANRKKPVPGGNDGASGVAVLYGLAAALEKDLPVRVTMALFDVEDQGSIEGYDDWCIGSTMVATYYAQQDRQPDAVIVLDMIGDPDLNVYRERNSDRALTDSIWAVAARLGYGDQLIDEDGYAILDDHIPFLRRGMRAVDLIDFDDPEWHTVRDDLSNVSRDSLQVIGDVMLTWLREVGEKGSVN